MVQKNSFVVFIICLIVSTVIFKQIKYSQEPYIFLRWLSFGGAFGILAGLGYLWVKKPSQTSLKNADYFKNNINYLFGILVLVISFSFGIALFDYGMSLQKMAAEVQNWPSVSAVITGHETDLAPAGKIRIPRWSAVWTYRYNLSGTDYNSRSNSAPMAYIKNAKYTEAEVKQDLARRPIGSSVIAYYNISNPNESVLDRENKTPSDMNIFKILGIVILLISIIAMCFTLPKMKISN